MQTLRCGLSANGDWLPAKVTKVGHGPCKYLFTTNSGTMFQRNCKIIKPSNYSGTPEQSTKETNKCPSHQHCFHHLQISECTLLSNFSLITELCLQFPLLKMHQPCIQRTKDDSVATEDIHPSAVLSESWKMLIKKPHKIWHADPNLATLCQKASLCYEFIAFTEVCGNGYSFWFYWRPCTMKKV